MTQSKREQVATDLKSALRSIGKKEVKNMADLLMIGLELTLDAYAMVSAR